MDLRISQFTVVRGRTDSLVERVNELIELGWQPWGDFQHAGVEAGEEAFYGQQAMVRYEGATGSPAPKGVSAVGNC